MFFDPDGNELEAIWEPTEPELEAANAYWRRAEAGRMLGLYFAHEVDCNAMAELPRDEYGFTPLPSDGFSIRQKLAMLLALAVGALLLLLIALALQAREERDRFDNLWTGPYEQLSSYEYVAVDEQGRQLHVLYLAPSYWLVESPGGIEVSGGETVSIYSSESHSYAVASVAESPNHRLSGPLGVRDPADLRRLIENNQGIGTWSVNRQNLMGREVDVVKLEAGFAQVSPATLVHTMTIDPQYMFLLGDTLTSSSNMGATSMVATRVDYNPSIPLEAFVFHPPEGSCRRVSAKGC